MAKVEAVWGVDLGNCSLKAVRCRLDAKPDRVVADAFDYIEYPKILTQPGAEPEELISDALAQFQARNNIRGDRVAVCVSGQSGLARFIKLPPVEAKRIPDIVRYEARQQIPFDLDDVIWDYQQIAGGMEVEGFVLEAEVGIFAMKRDQVFRALEPLRSVGIDVDFVQLAPLALYNFLCFDQLHDLPPAEEYDPEDPPPSWIVLSMGTDATDLVVTNGYRVWQRSIPIGGNHFTKALTKELRLTFAKAEHLKRNASSAQDPKAVFQAMRPVFSDLLTEIQRSINYFTSIDRAAKIGKILTLGNAMKLPGLQRYLGQNLGYEVVRVDSFRGLAGPEVVGTPAFKENLLAFAPCYGLALQGLGKSALRTNLLPREIVKDRLIRQKKPWAVAAAAVFLLGCTISYASFSRAMGTMAESVYGAAEQEAEAAAGESSSLKSEASGFEDEFWGTDDIGKHLVENIEGRLRWLELLKGVNSCLPRDPEGRRPKEIALRNELHITSLQCYRLERLEDWFATRQKWYNATEEQTAASSDPAAAAASPAPGATPASQAPAGTPADGTAVDMAAASQPAAPVEGGGPTGPGWVVRLTGYHYHNHKRPSEIVPRGTPYLQGAQFVDQTLIENLKGNGEKLILPKGDEQGQLEAVSVTDLDIGYPVLVDPGQIYPHELINPNVKGALGRGMPGEAMGYGSEGYGMEGYGPGGYGMDGYGTGGGSRFGPGYMGGPGRRPGTSATEGEEEEEEAEEPVIDVLRFDFVVEFCWQPEMPGEGEAQDAEQPLEQQPLEQVGQAEL
jgi:type IV pilus assembly protein PilM